ncbi:ISNCY family transposase [Desulfovibrio sp. OttesenSCG-928-M14]|nr:ISNCY family transposase [Desulfovibrio sp. OttesenSCG-928-M14]
MRFLEVNTRFHRGDLNCEQAAELMGVSVSTFFRKRRRFAEEGEEGLVDRRIGKLSARRVPVDEVMEMIALFESKYYDFTVKHFHEKLTEKGYRHSYTLVKNKLQEAGVVKKAKKRGQHRRKRPRRPLPGMMLHQDGSTHEWVPGKYWDLIVTMDDATSETYSMFFCDEEGTRSSFQGLSESIKKYGLPCSIYVDRGSHYFYTPKAGEKVDKERLTQVGRAMRQLGIEMIPAYSPEARGRSERMFGTLQKRLPQELRLCGITDMAEANRFLREEFLPAHNARFAKPAEFEGNAFTPLYGFALDDVLCIQEERTVSNDNTVKYKGNILQLMPDASRLHYARSKVRVHEYPDGGLAVFHGPRKLATELIEDKDNQEQEIQDAFIAFVPSSEQEKMEGEAGTSPSPDFTSHLGTQFRVTQGVSARM